MRKGRESCFDSISLLEPVAALGETWYQPLADDTDKLMT